MCQDRLARASPSQRGLSRKGAPVIFHKGRLLGPLSFHLSSSNPARKKYSKRVFQAKAGGRQERGFFCSCALDDLGSNMLHLANSDPPERGSKNLVQGVSC